MTLGNRIKEFRELRGWKQSEFANKIGVKQPTIAAWETGVHEFKPDNLKKICEVLNVTPNELYGITPPSTTGPDQRLIPVFNASCGKFIDWSDGSYPVGHYPENNPTDSKDPHAFYVRAHGDSMIGRADEKRNIFEGDLLLVEPSQALNDGDLVFCRHDDKGITIKKFKHTKTSIHLIPLNDKYDIITLTPKDRCHCFKITEIKRKI